MLVDGRTRGSGALAFALATLCLASAPAAASSFITSYANEHGLPQVTIYDVVTDDDGYLLIGTQDGLARFDGYRFDSFRHNPDEPDSLAGNRIKKLLPDRGGRVWIGTDGGLNVYVTSTGAVQRFDHDFSHAIVDLALDSDGRLWVATKDDGIFVADPDSEQISPAPIDPPRGVTAVAYDLTGVLWVGTEKSGLARLDPASGTLAPYAGAFGDALLKSDRITELYVDRDDRLWIGYWEAGFSALAPDRRTISHRLPHPLGDELNDETVYAFLNDRLGRVWIGGFGGGGVVRWDPQSETIRQFRASPDGLRNDRTLSFFEDWAGSVWIGTAAGLSRLDPDKEKFGHIAFGPQTGGLSHRDVTAVFEDEAGRLWIGTYGGGLARYDDTTGIIELMGPDSGARHPLAGNEVIALAQADDGRLWVGTTKGLSRYDPVSGRSENFHGGDGRGLAGDLVSDIRRDRRDRVWLLVEGTVQLHDPGRDRFCTLPIDLGPVVHLFHRANHTWVVAGDDRVHAVRVSGVDCRSAESAPVDLPPEIDGKIEPLLEDSRGQVWAGHRSGLVRLSPDLSAATAVGGLPSTIVYGALEGGSGNVWVSTNRGLVRLQSEGNRETFTIADGLQSNEFSGEDSLKRGNGQLVFAGVNGVNVFDPTGIRRNPIPPRVHVTSWRIFDNVESASERASDDSRMPLANGQRLSLQRPKYGFEIGFTGLHYLEPAANQFAYRLEGLDDDWIEAADDQRYARYTNLSPGEYKLEVRASNAHGIPSPEPAWVAITVLPAWWESTPAYAAYLAALVAFVLMVIRWRTLTLQRRAAVLEAQVRDRTRDIAAKKEIIERQVEELKSLDQAKERFFENISHDFRTPLTLIIGPLKRLLDASDHPPAVREKLEMARRNATRLLGLINELLQLSRLKSGVLRLNRRTYRVAQHVRLIVREIAPEVRERKIELGLDLDDDLRLSYDAEAMEKIIVNLLSNAIKYTPPGGRIAIRASAEPDGCTVLQVSDTGEGIAPADLPRIFERFRQGPESARHGEGSGIGLSLVKELVELHGAGIEAESAVGEGTCFTIRFPPGDAHEEPAELEALEASGPAERERAIPARSAPPERPLELLTDGFEHTILIVEDDPEMRAYLAEVLDGYRLLMAENGRSGLDRAIEELPDLILSDVMMPEMDGLELSRAIRAHEDISHVPLILLTAKGGRQSKLDGLSEGVDDYLVKPFDEDELRLKIRNLIALRDHMARGLGRDDPSGDQVSLPARERPFFGKLKRVLEEHFSDPDFTAPGIPEEMGKSARTVQRKLRAVLDQTPTEHLRLFRLHKAATRLLAGSSVSDACFQSGFPSLAGFSRLFKEHFRVSPSHYTGKNGK